MTMIFAAHSRCTGIRRGACLGAIRDTGAPPAHGEVLANIVSRCDQKWKGLCDQKWKNEESRGKGVGTVGMDGRMAVLMRRIGLCGDAT